MSVKKVREEDSQGHVIYKETSSDMVVREDGTTVEDGLKEAEAPTFDDTGTVSGINSFQTFYQSIVSKMPFINFLRNFKAGLNFIVNTGQIVNNGTTNQAGFVLDARMGKVLQDKITELDSNVSQLTNGVMPIVNKLDLQYISKISVLAWNATDVGFIIETSLGKFQIVGHTNNNTVECYLIDS